MWAGVPVLLSDRVGLCREVVADEAGVVVPIEQRAMTHALEQLLTDPERLAFLGQRASVSARERYDNSKVCHLLATAYEDVLTGRRSPGLSGLMVVEEKDMRKNINPVPIYTLSRVIQGIGVN